VGTDGRTSAPGTLATLVRAARRAPVTCTLIVAGWVSGIVALSFPGSAGRFIVAVLGTGPGPLAAGHC